MNTGLVWMVMLAATLASGAETLTVGTGEVSNGEPLCVS